MRCTEKPGEVIEAGANLDGPFFMNSTVVSVQIKRPSVFVCHWTSVSANQRETKTKSDSIFRALSPRARVAVSIA